MDEIMGTALGALAWELRAAASLARLRSRQGRAAEGRGVLAAVHGRFAGRFGTANLREARRRLDDAGTASPVRAGP